MEDASGDTNKPSKRARLHNVTISYQHRMAKPQTRRGARIQLSASEAIQKKATSEKTGIA